MLIKRFVVFSLILLVMHIAPAISPMAYAAERADKTEAIGVKNPATDLWRAVRQRQFNGDVDINTSSQVKGVNSGLLINAEGDKWRHLRKQKLIPYSAYFILGVIVCIALLFPIIRRVKIPNGRSGKKVSRLSGMQRFSHWFMVVLVVLLAFTGLLLLFGRHLIIPLIGGSSYSFLASISKTLHDLIGPVLILSLLMMLIYFIRHNLPARGDFKWLLTAGGLFTKKHLKNGFFNAGEKILYWVTLILGMVLSVTGLMLLFPSFELTTNNSQLALIIHAVTALLLIALALAHIFMSIKIEGTIEAMTKGNVDENWAKGHHSRWYEDQASKSKAAYPSSDKHSDSESISGQHLN